MRIQRAVYLFAALFAFSNACIAQSIPSTAIRSLTVDDGLPQGFVSGIVEDNRGFVWISTREGIARYDGKNLKTFRHDPLDSNSISTNIVAQMSRDRDGRIWIQHENDQLDVLDPVKESFRHLSGEKPFSWIAPGTFIKPLEVFQDGAGRFYILYFDRKAAKTRMSYFSWEDTRPETVGFPTGEFPTHAATDAKTKCWVTSNKALYLSLGHGPLRPMSMLPAGLVISDPMTSLPLGEIQVEKTSGDLLISNGQDAWNYSVAAHQWRKWLIPAAIRAKTNHFELASDGKIYLHAGTKYYRLNPDQTYSLLWINDTRSTYLVTCIDSANLLLAGTNGFGLRMIDLNDRGFHAVNYKNDAFADPIFSFGRRITMPSRNLSEIQSNSYIRRSCLDRNDDLWFINLPFDQVDGKNIGPGSFVMLSKSKSEVRTFPLPAGTSFDNFAFDSQNRCWAVIDNRFLASVDFQHLRVNDSMDIVPQNETVNYMLSADGKLWLVYPDALQSYDPYTKHAVWYDSRSGLSLLRANFLLMACADPANKGVLWLATMGGGLIRFDSEKKMATSFTQKNGLPNNTVYAIIADRRNFLWCSTNKGLFRFDPATRQTVCFTQREGLSGDEFNRFHFLKLIDRHIAFGGIAGWTTFDPDSVIVDEFQPRVEITAIDINNNEISTYSAWKDSAVSAIDNLSLGHQMNYLSFHFAGLQYNDPDKLQYRYLLSGVDENWVYAGNLSQASYSNLLPGHYTLTINATNTSGIWSSHLKKISIVILPPWWRTWWVYCLYAVVAGSLVAFFFQYRINQIRSKQQIALKVKEALQLKDVNDMKSRFFSNITHEFRTPLSLIISPLEQIQQDVELPPETQKKLSTVLRSGQQLLRLVNQLLDISKLESHSMKLAFSRGDLGQFVHDCVESFAGVAEKKRVALRFHSNASTDECVFDEDKWEKITYNLLSNAIKFTAVEGAVDVRFSMIEPDGNDLVAHLQVRDNGIGIPPNQLGSVFNRFFQADDSGTRKYGGTGIGLALVKELAELMGGSIAVNSRPGAGAVFDLRVPIQRVAGKSTPKLTDETPHRQIAYANGPGQILTQNGHAPLILVVEDNDELSTFIAECLRPYYRVLTASDGASAIPIATLESPDIIISDIMMPELDGYGLCQRIKSSPTTNHIAIILLTAKTAHQSLMQGLESGADDYITKPFHVDELKLRIGNILERQEKLRLLFQSQLSNPQIEIYETDVKNDFINQLYQIIDAHLDDPTLSVEKLASKAALSHRTLNRKLANIAGLSAGELIRQYRLKRSIEFLKTGQNISEAAYSVGFNTPSHFTTSFKAFFGLTPSEFLHKVDTN